MDWGSRTRLGDNEGPARAVAGRDEAGARIVADQIYPRGVRPVRNREHAAGECAAEARLARADEAGVAQVQRRAASAREAADRAGVRLRLRKFQATRAAEEQYILLETGSEREQGSPGTQHLM